MQIMAFIFIGLLLISQTTICKEYSLGLTTITCVDESRIFDNVPRKLEVTIWYPTSDEAMYEKIENETWQIKDVIKNASLPADQQFPLIIFSHGYSGNQWQNSWFAENLVPHGYIVAMVRHYGNSMPTMIPEICVRPWNRPQDISFVLDCILKDTKLQQHIDNNRIGAAGFSQGGMACLWLAGVRAHLTPENIKQQLVMMFDPEMQAMHFKDILPDRLNALLDNFTAKDFEQSNKSYYDERFKAVFAMAPGIDDHNIMFTSEGLALGATPTHIVVGADDEGTVEQTPFFAQHMLHCTHTIIPGHVTHWTLLNEGTIEGKLKKPYLTIDHPSIDRNKIHRLIADEALCFFNYYLQ